MKLTWYSRLFEQCDRCGAVTCDICGAVMCEPCDVSELVMEVDSEAGLRCGAVMCERCGVSSS